MQHVRRERRLRAHPLWQRQRPVVHELLSALRGAETREDYVAFHAKLLATYLDVQAEASEAASRLRSLRAHSKSGRRRVGRALQDELDRAREDQYAASAALGTLRSLGDALVWRVLRYRRGLITAVGQGRRVDRLPSGRGLASELAAMDELRRNGAFALATGLTNCVTYGDVLVIDDWARRDVRLVEVKASGRRPRPRQAERLAHVNAVIAGQVETTDPQRPARPIDCTVELGAHHKTLAELLDSARQETYAWREPEAGLLVTAVDETDPAGKGPSLDSLRKQTVDAIGWGTVAGTSTGEWSGSSANRLLRDRRYSFPGQAPLSLLPLDVGTVVEILTGTLLYYTNVSVPGLVRRFGERGIAVELPQSAAATEREFMAIGRGTDWVELPLPAKDQLLLELMTLESFVDVGEWLVDLRRRSPGCVFGLDFSSEPQLWEL